jgi:hypothetical protein
MTMLKSGVPGRQLLECDVNNPIASVVCSFDGGTPENCTFPVVVGIDRFGTDNHTLLVTVLDVFEQTVSQEFFFRLIEPDLEGYCSTSGVPGRQLFRCSFNNTIASVVCSFDGGTPENCTFPVVVGIDRFGTDNHTLLVTVLDVFEQTVSQEFFFRLIELLQPPPPPDLEGYCSTSGVPGRQLFRCSFNNTIASVVCSL